MVILSVKWLYWKSKNVPNYYLPPEPIQTSSNKNESKSLHLKEFQAESERNLHTLNTLLLTKIDSLADSSSKLRQMTILLKKSQVYSCL